MIRVKNSRIQKNTCYNNQTTFSADIHFGDKAICCVDLVIEKPDIINRRHVGEFDPTLSSSIYNEQYFKLVFGSDFSKEDHEKIIKKYTKSFTQHKDYKNMMQVLRSLSLKEMYING